MERISAIHVPIAPSPRHRETKLQLKLCHGLELRYRSYVQIDHQYDISLNALKMYPWASSMEVRLQAKSLSTVRKHVDSMQSTQIRFRGCGMILSLQRPRFLLAENKEAGSLENQISKGSFNETASGWPTPWRNVDYIPCKHTTYIYCGLDIFPYSTLFLLATYIAYNPLVLLQMDIIYLIS